MATPLRLKSWKILHEKKESCMHESRDLSRLLFDWLETRLLWPLIGQSRLVFDNVVAMVVDYICHVLRGHWHRQWCCARGRQGHGLYFQTFYWSISAEAKDLLEENDFW